MASRIVWKKLVELRFQVVPQLIYLPDQALSRFQLFPKSELFLIGRECTTNEEIITEVEQHFNNLDTDNKLLKLLQNKRCRNSSNSF